MELKNNEVNEFIRYTPFTVLYDSYYDYYFANEDFTGVYLRSLCIRGISELAKNEEGNLIYTSGNAYICHDDNTNFGVGETLKIMYHSKLISDELQLQEYFINMFGDPNLKICTCFAEDGQTEIPCEVEACASNGQTETEPCGLNGAGQRQRVCEESSWSIWSDCVDPDVCVNNQSVTQDCGIAGTQTIVCSEGQWGQWSDCDDPLACDLDETFLTPKYAEYLTSKMVGEITLDGTGAISTNITKLKIGENIYVMEDDANIFYDDTVGNEGIFMLTFGNRIEGESSQNVVPVSLIKIKSSPINTG